MAFLEETLLDALRLDPAAETDRIATAIQETVSKQLRRRGVVVGVSGGIDSSVVVALCARALGKDRVLALLMPEAESSPESTRLGRMVIDALGVPFALEDITPVLAAAGCYRRRDDAIRCVIPEYGEGCKSKIVLPNVLEEDRFPFFTLVAQMASGETRKGRLPLEGYLGIVAATSFKQRVRKMMEYYHADRLNFAVAGTPNRLEYELGFFVKNGDGAADIKPIAHLYKTQVFQLAAYLGIPDEIQRRTPTTDTYPMEQSQEEFYFSVPLATMDACLYGKDHGLSPQELAPQLGLTAEQVNRVYASIDSKRRASQYLQLPPVVFG